MALRRRPSPGVVRSARAVAVVLLLQLLVGALNVWLDEYEALIVLHLALGTLLWRPRSASPSSSTACPRPPASARADAPRR